MTGGFGAFGTPLLRRGTQAPTKRSLSGFVTNGQNCIEVTGILNNGDISNERNEEKSHCAGGRSDILLKAKASFCVVEEAPSGDEETPQTTIQKHLEPKKI